MSPQRPQGERPLALLLPALMIVLGVAIVVRTIAAGGGPVAVGVLLGALFIAAGGLRLYAERRAP